MPIESWFVCRLCAIAYPSATKEAHVMRHAAYLAVYSEVSGAARDVVVRIPPRKIAA